MFKVAYREDIDKRDLIDVEETPQIVEVPETTPAVANSSVTRHGANCVGNDMGCVRECGNKLGDLQMC